MIETKNTIIYNRYKDDITLIHNHTNITVEEIIIDKKNNVHFSFDFKFERLLYCDVESKWKNYHIITFPG